MRARDRQSVGFLLFVLECFLLGLVLGALSGCGAGAPGEGEQVDVRSELPALNPEPAPGLPTVLPAGWFVHLYPHFCAVVLRDQAGRWQTCVRWPECPGEAATRCDLIRR